MEVSVREAGVGTDGIDVGTSHRCKLSIAVSKSGRFIIARIDERQASAMFSGRVLVSGKSKYNLMQSDRMSVGRERGFDKVDHFSVIEDRKSFENMVSCV